MTASTHSQLIKESTQEAVQAYNSVYDLDEDNLPFHLTRSLSEMGMTSRLSNQMKAAGAKTLNDIRYFTREKFLQFRNFGTRSLQELDAIVTQNGGWFFEDHEKPALIQEQLKHGARLNFMRDNPDFRPLPVALPLTPTQVFIKETREALKKQDQPLSVIVPENISDLTNLIEKLKQDGHDVQVTLTLTATK